VLAWSASGIYVVLPDEQAIVLRFGAIAASTSPGLHYHWPWPIESVYTPKVTRENQLDIGYRLSSTGPRDETRESLSLTGDENIIDVDFTVYWRIGDASAFLFNVQNPGGQVDATIRSVAESAMREVVGKSSIGPILTTDRAAIQDQIKELTQGTLNAYGAGIIVTRVQLQKADPPAQVLQAYRDVQVARTDQERMRNEAEAYANKAVPEGRGTAARILRQAEGYKQQVTKLAHGESRRFIAVQEQYKKAPEVTRERIYIDTMESILAGVNKVIVDNVRSPGVVLYLPLPELRRPLGAAPPSGVDDRQRRPQPETGQTPFVPLAQLPSRVLISTGLQMVAKE